MWETSEPCCLSSRKCEQSCCSSRSLFLLVPMTCSFYSYQGSGALLGLYHLLFRCPITDCVRRGTGSLKNACCFSRYMMLLKVKINSMFIINIMLYHGSYTGSIFVEMFDCFFVFVCFFFVHFQYSGDSDDKLWLYEQNELPITGGKVQ